MASLSWTEARSASLVLTQSQLPAPSPWSRG